jgi:RING finger protein 170
LGHKDKITRKNLHEIREFNGIELGDRTWIDAIFDIPFLLREFIREVGRTRGGIIIKHPSMMIRIALMIFYIYTPTDLLPESIYGIYGYVDDLIIFWIFGISFTVSMLQIMRENNRDDLVAMDN